MLNTYLANANIIRLLVVMTLRRAKIKQTRGSLVNSVSQLSKYQYISAAYINRQIAPALFLVVSIRIWRRGPAEELATLSMSPATNKRTIRKIEPVNVPMPTQ